MMALGVPILNDGLYPVLTPKGQMDDAKPLQLLAKRLAFADPISGLAFQFESCRSLGMPHLLTLQKKYRTCPMEKEVS